MWLGVMFIVLSGEDIRRLRCQISLTLFRDEREHYSLCNNAAVDYANNDTDFVLRFIKF
jgi:hypothetical protein